MGCSQPHNWAIMLSKQVLSVGPLQIGHEATLSHDFLHAVKSRTSTEPLKSRQITGNPAITDPTEKSS